MSATASPSGKKSLLEHLRDAHFRGVSGALEYEVGGRHRRVLLRSGAIFVPPDSPLAALVEKAGGADAEQDWDKVLARLAEHYLAEGVPHAIALGRLERLPAGAAGPIPTGALLRRAFALAATTESAPTESARSLALPLVADTAATGSRREPACWSPEEAWVLERLRQVMTLERLREQCPFPESRLTGVVAGLRQLGLVRSPDEASAVHHDSGLLKLSELLRTRIAASLRERPLGLLDDALQRRLESLLQRAESGTLYELLGVEPSADEAEIQRAFEALARQIHPSHAERPGIHVSRVELSELFDRSVAAIRTLSDPALRVEYDNVHGIERSAADDGGSGERRAEVAEMARREFDRARFEELNGDLYTALVLYEQAASLAPCAEYWVALARLQSKNSAWSGRALESYRRALGHQPEDAEEIRFAMGRVLEGAGQLDEAVSYYQAAAQADPPHAEARKALKRLAAHGHGRDPDGGGRLGRLFGRS